MECFVKKHSFFVCFFILRKNILGGANRFNYPQIKKQRRFPAKRLCCVFFFLFSVCEYPKFILHPSELCPPGISEHQKENSCRRTVNGIRNKARDAQGNIAFP